MLIRNPNNGQFLIHVDNYDGSSQGYHTSLTVFSENKSAEFLQDSTNLDNELMLITQKIVDGIEQNGQLSGLHIFPNPTSSFITVHIEGSAITTGVLEIRDINYNLYYSEDVNTTRSEINVENLASGIYFVLFRSDEMIIQGYFVKQ